MNIDIKIKKDAVLRSEVRGIDMLSDNYEVSVSYERMNDVKKNMEKRRDRRGDWPSLLYTEVRKKMKFIKKGNVDINKLHTDETLIAFADKLVSTMKFNPVPKQKTIKETTEKKHSEEKEEVTEEENNLETIEA